jgi:Insertion element 4 transposase N-terminal/Transposase DDE domain
VFEPGHLGELTQVIDTELVDEVLCEQRRVQARVRVLPSRVVVYFILALALFEQCSYRSVWAKLTVGLRVMLAVPSRSGLCRARRRVGAGPLKALFQVLAGPVGWPRMSGVWYRGLRLVAVDGTLLHVPDTVSLTAQYRKRSGFGYPLLRLLVVVECGTRALIGAVFGPETVGETDYAARLTGCLRSGMLLLADCRFDAATLLCQVRGTHAQFLVRSSAVRRPQMIGQRFTDGSFLSVLAGGLKVRVIEAVVTITMDDGTRRNEPWRLVTSLLDYHTYSASELVSLYHERWEIETTYYALKSTILDGRVLRSQCPDGIEQEVYALLTVYQALIMVSVDAIASRPDVDPDRISFIIALHTAQDLVIASHGITPDTNTLIGVIGLAVLADLNPPRRHRIKARSKKNPTSKYAMNASKHPRTSLKYTINTTIAVFEHGLTPRSNR